MEDNKIFQEDEEQGIDFVAYGKLLWDKRKFICKVVGVCFVIGLFIAIFGANEYTVTSVIVPQYSNTQSKLGGLSSLASLAGLSSMSSSGVNGELSPLVYPQVFNNVELKKELIYSKFQFEDFDEPISLFDYYMNPDYARFNIVNFVTAYTIGLPSKILGLIKGKTPDIEYVAGDNGPKLITLTKDESSLLKQLNNQLTIEVEQKNGYITLSASMPEQIAATQVQQRMSDLLQAYITKLKIEKVQENLDYVNARYADAEADYVLKQKIYAETQDANRKLTSAAAGIKLLKAQSDYEMAQSLFQQLAAQKVQAELQVKQDTPIFTIVEPAYVPYEKSSMSKIKVMIVWTILGFIFSFGWIIGKDFYIQNIAPSVKEIIGKK